MKNNKPKTTPDTFTASQVGALIERLEGQFKLFGEDLATIKGKVEAIFEEQGRQKEDIFIIKADIRIMKKDIAELKQDVAILKQDVTILKQDVAILKQDVAMLKQGSLETNSRLSKIEQTTKEILKTHDERITRLEVLK